ncbi:DIP13 [Symbiodinium sp. KB8]|nr:DIP13 [Symbiodinium sp. KB8]
MSRAGPLVWAHRGASKTCPENTMAAFRAGLAAGADGVELDVHPTLDGHVVVIHDATQDRTTEGRGLICHAPLEEIRRLDAGSKHSAAFRGEQVPLLGEVLDLAMNWPQGRRKVLIELKGGFSGVPEWVQSTLRRVGMLKKEPEPAYPNLARLVAEALAPYSQQVEEGFIVAQSFHQPYLHELRHLLPSLRVMYLSLSSATGMLEKENLQHVGLGFAGVAVRHSSLTASALKRLHLTQGQVFAWTVDAVDDIEAAVAIGVDGIITNYPDRALAILAGLVLFLTTLDLRRSLNLPGPQFRLADVPVHSGCCERYRILSGLLERLRQDLGKTKLVYVEVGVADGLTALFLLRKFGKKRWLGEPSISLEAARAVAGLTTELGAYSFMPQYFHLDFRDGMNTGKGGTLVRCTHGADCTQGCVFRQGNRNPDNVRCPACGHTWLTFFDDDFFNCVQCGRIRFECPQCRTQSEASRNYCRYCLSGCYDRTIVISLVVQQLQDCSLLIKCVTLAGEEILVTTLPGEETVGGFRPKAVEAALADSGCKRGEDGELCSEEQLREWGYWHDVYSTSQPGAGQMQGTCGKSLFWFLSIGSWFWECSGRASVQDAAWRRCRDGGGELLYARLQFGYTAAGQEFFAGLEVLDLADSADGAGDDVNDGGGLFDTACVPAKCAGVEEIASTPCAAIKGWLLRSLLDEHGKAYKDTGDIGIDHVFTTVLREHRWLIHGVEASEPAEPAASTSAIQSFPIPARTAPMDESSSGSSVRVALLSHHAPLANVFAEHIDHYAMRAGLEPFDFAYFSVCYLCQETSGCEDRKVPSRADVLCEYFHSTNVTFQQFYEVADDVAHRMGNSDLLVCYGLTFCHFMFSLLPKLPRLQFLGMNPLQSAPASLSGMLLLDLARRADQGDAIFCTSMVTWNLLAYHLGPAASQVASLTLFRATLTSDALKATWELNRKVLLASSFLMQVSAVYLAMRSALMQVSGFEFVEQTHNTPWSFASFEDVQEMLDHFCAVYFPEHPYKNYFNDMYAMLLPIFTPTLDFLAHIWQQLHDMEESGVYDGWFSRAIPRVRLRLKAEDDPLPPFDLGSNGLQKVLKWTAAADYFHFPGVMTFNGLADLTSKLRSQDLQSNLEDARFKMLQHVQSRREDALRKCGQVLNHLSARAEKRQNVALASWLCDWSGLPWLHAYLVENKPKSIRRRILPFTALTIMASQGATLQNYNNELVKSIEDLREKREELNRQILKEEEDKAKIQKELSILTDRLQKINESLVRKTQARNEYDKTIQETEAAYMKILESSQTLLHVLKRETVNLTKKKSGINDGLEVQLERLLSALRPVQDRAHLLPMDSVEAAVKFREAGLVADAVFLDGDHSATGIRRDLAAWVPLLGDGGLLAGHDFSWEHPGILETIFLERAGFELYLAPDHVFYWFQRSNQSDVHTRKNRGACGKNEGAPQSQGHAPCTLVTASEIIAIDTAGRWMPGNRRRRGPKGPVPNKESALSTAADGESERICGPLAPSVAVAAFRGAVAMDVKTGGVPLLIEVSSHLESITKVLFSQDSLEKTNLAEALWPILEGSGWEEERIERFCTTCWEAAHKAGLRRATQDRPQPTSRNPHQVLQRALSILAETHAQELVQEEEEQLSRSARRAAKAGRAFEPEVVAEDADDAASQYATHQRYQQHSFVLAVMASFPELVAKTVEEFGFRIGISFLMRREFVSLDSVSSQALQLASARKFVTQKLSCHHVIGPQGIGAQAAVEQDLDARYFLFARLSLMCRSFQSPMFGCMREAGSTFEHNWKAISLRPYFLTMQVVIFVACLLVAKGCFPKAKDPVGLADTLYSIPFFSFLAFCAMAGTLTLYHDPDSRWQGVNHWSELYLVLYVSRSLVHIFMQPFEHISRELLIMMTLHHIFISEFFALGDVGTHWAPFTPTRLALTMIRLWACFLLFSAAAEGSVSFLTLGDWGGYALGSFHQTTVTAVAQQMAKTATQTGASFVVNTGDNFYYCGITGTADHQVAEDFTNVYSNKSLKVPWYSVLGNHEYGYNVEAQCQLSSVLSNWVMDSRYFSKRVALGSGHFISFIFLDTSPCVAAYRADDQSHWDPCSSEFPTCEPIVEGPCKFHENILSQNCTTQFEWFKAELAKVPASDWLIVVGHHPADEMDVEDFVAPMVQHGFDLYLNGHTHLLNHYTINGGGAYVTSGAGAMVRTKDQDDEESHLVTGKGSKKVQLVWEEKVAGFTLHTFSSDFKDLKTDYISYTGDILHSFNVTRGSGPPPSPPSPPSQGSCSKYGCGRYDPSHTCQCNSFCKEHADCCSDYSKSCAGPSRGSCKEFGCGRFNPKQSCQCNSYCEADSGTPSGCDGPVPTAWEILQSGIAASKLQIVQTLNKISAGCMGAYVIGLGCGRCHFWGCLDGCCELTTIFLNNLYLLNDVEIDGRRLKEFFPRWVVAANGVILWVGFIAFRLALFPTWFAAQHMIVVHCQWSESARGCACLERAQGSTDTRQTRQADDWQTLTWAKRQSSKRCSGRERKNKEGHGLHCVQRHSGQISVTRG